MKLADPTTATQGPKGLPNVAEARATYLLGHVGAGILAHKDAHWPGGTLPYRYRWRGSTTIQLATAAAILRFKAIDLPILGETGDEFQDEVMIQLVYRMTERLVEPDGKEARPMPGDPIGAHPPLFDSADELREFSTKDQRIMVYNRIDALREEFDPDVGVDAATLAAIGTAVKKKDWTSLKEYGRLELLTFIISTAFLPATSLDSTSNGSSPSTSSSSSKRKRRGSARRGASRA